MKKGAQHRGEVSLQQRIKEGSLPPKVKAELASLSKELNMPEESLAELCVMMYRMYGNKA